MRRLVLVPTFFFGLWACEDGTGPDGLPLPVTIAVIPAPQAALPLSVAAGRRTLLIEGGPGLTCGISRASAKALMSNGDLTVQIELAPLGSCPFAPVEGQYAAIVSRVRPGWDNVEVRQRYWTDRPDVILRVRLFVSE